MTNTKKFRKTLAAKSKSNFDTANYPIFGREIRPSDSPAADQIPVELVGKKDKKRKTHICFPYREAAFDVR